MSTARAPFRIITTSDAATSTCKEWIVDNLLGAGEVSGLIAPPTSGKSAIALDLAASIASGADWFGRKVAGGAALYFATERAGVTLRRLRAYEVYHEVKRLNVGIVRDRLDLVHNSQDADRILDAIKFYADQVGAPIKLITIDTVRMAMGGGDENSPRDMGGLAQNVSRIRDGAPGAHIQLLHHSPKGRPDEASGHTALAAMLDALIVVTAKGDRRSWRVAEANDLPALPPAVPFTLQSVTVGKDGTTAPVVTPAPPAGAATAGKPEKLPPDATTALTVLRRLSNGTGEAISMDRWRNATLEEFGARKDGAKRQAFSSARRVLLQAGKVMDGADGVSVSGLSG